MARALLPYFNSSYGKGIEGAANYSNSVLGYWMVPVFLFVFWGAAISLLINKSDYKIGGIIASCSFVFFLLGMIAQTFTHFNQVVMFIFFIGIIAGIVISYIESAK